MLPPQALKPRKDRDTRWICRGGQISPLGQCFSIFCPL